GTASVKPIDMATAYATFASNGVHHDTHSIKKITQGAEDEEVYKADTEGKRVFDKAVAAEPSYALQQVINGGAGSYAQNRGRPPARPAPRMRTRPPGSPATPRTSRPPSSSTVRSTARKCRSAPTAVAVRSPADPSLCRSGPTTCSRRSRVRRSSSSPLAVSCPTSPSRRTRTSRPHPRLAPRAAATAVRAATTAATVTTP